MSDHLDHTACLEVRHLTSPTFSISFPRTHVYTTFARTCGFVERSVHKHSLYMYRNGSILRHVHFFRLVPARDDADPSGPRTGQMRHHRQTLRRGGILFYYIFFCFAPFDSSGLTELKSGILFVTLAT